MAELSYPTRRAPSRLQKDLFATGLGIYVCALLLAALVGLGTLWSFMNNYEAARPYRPVEAFVAGRGEQDWRDYLLQFNLDRDYLDTLALSDVSYYKLMGEYTDAAPVYGVRFGTEAVLRLRLVQAGELSFGMKRWGIGSAELIGSGLSIYAPRDAAVLVRGVKLGSDSLMKEDAQPLSLGELEAGRTDIPGLSRYAADWIYSNAEVTVIDSQGRELELGYSKGRSYYYPPLMEDYTITAPSTAAVRVNGVELSEANATVTRLPLSAFEGIEESLPFVPADVQYGVRNLVARPVVEWEDAGGGALRLEEEGNTFTLRRDTRLPEELEDYVHTVFDAYIAFSGNRGGKLQENYSRYRAYLLPQSEAARRAAGALESLVWVAGRDQFFKAADITQATLYSDELFTCTVDFEISSQNTTETDRVLLVFVQRDGAWKLVRVLNQTAYFHE